MLDHLAEPRVDAVRRFFRAESDREMLGCYAWCQCVSAGLLPILGDFEVALRNALHRAFSVYFGCDTWMLTRPNPAALRSPVAKPLPAAHKMPTYMQQDVQRAADKIRRRKGNVLPDDVVAALPFGFWEQLINSLGHKSHPADLQGAVLSSVFANAPCVAPDDYGTKDFRERTVALMGQLRDVRNRIGHHDSIWAVPEFDLFGKRGFIPRRPRHTVTSLKLFAERLAWFAGWIDPSIPVYMRRSDHWWSFMSLLDQQALLIYRQTGGRIGSYEQVLRRKANVSPLVLSLRKPSFHKCFY